MEHTIYLSQLGHIARTRGLTVAELQRRLKHRGLTVSRGALDRLFSQRPVREVSLEIVVPVLEELDVDLRSAFRRVTRDDADVMEAARNEAAWLARQFPTARGTPRRRASIAAAEAELTDVGDRLEVALRRRHPELFDSRGRLRRRALTRLLAERTGKRLLTSDEMAVLSRAASHPPNAT